MKEVNIVVKARRSMIFWIVMAVIGVASLPIMIVALVNENWAIAIPAMVMVVFNFYGQPMGWISVGTLMAQKEMFLLITADGMTDLTVLASTIGKKQKAIRADVQKLIAKRYLRGYVLSEDSTKLIQLEKPQEVKKTSQNRCGYCGAEIPEDSKYCVYCRSRI